MDANEARSRPESFWRDTGGPLGVLLLATFLIRAAHSGQPIVENYVGRQVPTAMVARNLDRGSGLLRPQLDTAPFPNFFLVEPPLYEAGVVALKRATGLSLEVAGRLLSALSMAVAAWGLFELARPREGRRVALAAVSAFAVFPLTIRYGRAFQPDAAMLGAVVAGLACWDRYRARPHWPWLTAGWLLVALGFALKITAGFLLVPLVIVIAGARRRPVVLAACSTLVPALLWYAWAEHLVDAGAGSRASADNRSIWLGLLGPSALLKTETWTLTGWFLLFRAFTPLGAGLAVLGLWNRRRSEFDQGRLWRVWGISALVAMAFLAEKLHHEYYWMVVAPVAAVGVGARLEWLLENHKAGAIAVAAALVLLCAAQVRSTWRTPEEWRDLQAAATTVETTVPRGVRIVAPEALLFQADRRGCRMEWTMPAAHRAAGEWGTEQDVKTPLDLLAYYRRRGARYFADLGSRNVDERRKGLHDAVRQRYKVIVDRPEVIIADLFDSGMHWNAN